MYGKEKLIIGIFAENGLSVWLGGDYSFCPNLF